MPFFGGVALGAVICGLPYLVYGAEFPPWQLTMLALGLASLGLAIMRPADRWWSGAGVAAGIAVPILATIIVDVQRDPTAHNLAPFEFIIGFSISLPPAMLGALFGGLGGRVRFPRTLTGGAIAMIGVVAAAADSSVTLAATTAAEAAAEAKMKLLLAAEARYRAANPAIGFTCDLAQLGERFDAPPQRFSPNVSRAGVYRAGTQAVVAGYTFTLACSDAPAPRAVFALWATAGPGATVRWVYCAEADGRLRSAGRHRINFCLSEGAILQ